MATKATPAGARASDPIVDWRVEQLVGAGFAADDALTLAVRSEIDLHRAAALLRDGCPVELALRILL